MSSWKKKLYISAICGAMAFAGIASQSQAATITSLVGDIDGFGGQTAPGAIGVSVDAESYFDNRTASDPLFTDVWQYAQEDGAPGASPLTYAHTYDLAGGTATSASLTIMEAGMGDTSGTWSVQFNGTEIGSFTSGSEETSTLRSFIIDPTLIGVGPGIVSLIFDGYKEGYAIDYSSLSIEVSAVPLPAAMPLFGACLAVMGFFGWRRNKKTS